MKTFRISSVLVTALTVTALSVGSALAARSVAFTGSYSGKATEKVDGQTVTAVATGTGTGSLVGKSTINGTVSGTTTSPPCAPFTGPGTIAGKGGTLKLNVVNPSRACATSEDDTDHISFSGTATVKGGTAKYKKARGSLHFSGQYNRSSGAFTVKFTGKVSL